MGSTSPLVIVLAIISALAFFGAILAYIRRNTTFHGYEEIRIDVGKIAHTIKGEVFRDGEDLVIAGNLNNLPTTVRFSYQENTPGLNIRMEAPSTFTLSMVPQGSTNIEGKVAIRTTDPQFDTRFTTRTDHPTQARMLLGSRSVTADLQRLCCGSKTFFSLTAGAMELSELTIPPYAGHHVTEHLQQLGRVGTAVGEMPGSEAVKIQPIRRDRMLAARIAIAVGVVFAIFTVVAAVRTHDAPPDALASDPKPVGISPADASLIPGVSLWRVATEEDFDPTAVTWLHNNRRRADGRIEGDFSGTGEGRDVAYVLRRDDGSFRVVILIRGENRYDVSFSTVAAATRIPKGILGSIEWASSPPDEPDGDGLLLVLQPGNTASGVVVFSKAGRTISAAPANYQNISF
jgi:hypothetical protein